MRRVLCLAVLAAVLLPSAIPPAAAAPGDHRWSRGFDPEPRADITPDGSVVMAGMFYQTVDFGGGPLTPAGFGGDMFVARLDPNGTHVFSFKVTAGQGHSVSLVRADPGGGFYVVGRVFSGSVDFGGGPLAASTSLYVVRYDAAGNHVFSGLYGDAEIADATADAQGILLAGLTRSTADFGGGPLTTVGGTDAIVARLSSTGTHVFSRRYGDSFDQSLRAIGADAGGAPVFAAQIAGSVDFGGGALVPAGFGLALVELDGTGNHVRSTLYDGDFTSGIVYNVHLDVGIDGAFVVAGELHGSCDFGGGALSTAGNTDVYVARFDTDGNHQFSASYGSASYQVVNSVDLTPAGEVLLSGNFVNTLDFGGGALTAGAFESQLFLARLDADGAHLASTAFTGSFGGFSLASTAGANGATLLVASGTPDMDLGGGPLGEFYNFLGVLEGENVTAVTTPARVVLGAVGNHPNPFNPRTTLTFEIEATADVRLTITDARGRRVLGRDLGTLGAGAHGFTWDGRDEGGAMLASGVYSARVEAAGEARTRSLVLVR